MSTDLLLSLLRAVRGTDVTELDYQAGDIRIQLSRDCDAGAVPRKTQASATPAEPLIESGTKPEQQIFLRANLAGLFYRAESPDSPPFVQVGDEIQEGAQIGVLEAMKLLHPLEAEESGRVVEILVENGMAVEVGTPIMVLQPAGGHDV